MGRLNWVVECEKWPIGRFLWPMESKKWADERVDQADWIKKLPSGMVN